MRRGARLAAALGFVAFVTAGASARAFCRERTCDANDPKQQCEVVDNCVMSGHLLYWSSSCVSYDAQADGSPLRHITADQVTEVAGLAFAPWLAADCGNGTPSMNVGTFGPVECDEQENPDPNHPNEYNRAAEKGANVIMFRDDGWPYQGSIDAYALTTVTFNPETGELFDADIEVNSTDFDVSVDGTGTDLQSILTHEVGHFLGMAHAASSDQTATMRQSWDGRGTDLRTLTADDEAGICDAYPPDRSASGDCNPLNGFTKECHVPADKPESGGCTLAVARTHGDPASHALLAAGGLFAARVLRRHRRRRAEAGRKFRPA